MLDLSIEPYNLKPKQIDFIKNKLETMSLDEKIGQLFLVIEPEENLEEFIIKYNPGGIMFRPGKSQKIKYKIKTMMNQSKIPLFIAANLESGGNGIVKEGTWVGNPLQIAATTDPKYSYQLGNISGSEAYKVGCNMSFSPIVDIDYNFRNPITNTRTFGSDPEVILKMAKYQIKGLIENNIIPTIKHFPGDGVDERDQHLVSSINSLSLDDWKNSYGHIYKSLIDQGIPSIMVGHIYQPEWEKKLNPSIKKNEFRPASTSKLLINGLLRDILGYNGLAITDATAMVGYNVIDSRINLLPQTINAGIDMILFNKNIDEDYNIIKEAILSGIISQERFNEALTRILATKLSQGILRTERLDIQDDIKEHSKSLQNINIKEIIDEIAQKSVTLVKDREQLLPISVKKTPRVRLVVLGDVDEGGFKEGGKVGPIFNNRLEDLGFQVTTYKMDFHEVFEEGVEDLKEKFDIAIYVANIETASNQTTVRINWIQLMAANAPWFMASIPTIFISTANPYHLFDVPYLSTYINGYTSNPETVEAIIRKIIGQEIFEGISPIDPFCGDFVAKN
ncbi:glycoside hydrolase family 3 protein [Lactococcus lactis]|uniref:beta-N-acetylhexosaminidase n=1 Tax=Lactococcus lactis TaxID=1358 RepID=A0A9X4NJ46_9LACT|nr:glycoside hydrolase family 3 N-terminal domain-containing protein [Lactococcus lactis]MDG4982396.1 glycoside hydrolase family 3 protein [Lactococcus lactis]